MSNTPINSAKREFSLPGARPAKLSADSLLSGMTKDVGKRWLIVGGVVIAVLAGASTFMASKTTTAPVSKVADSKSIDTTPRGIASQADWKAQTGADLADLKKNLADSKKNQGELLARMESLRQELAQVKTAPSSSAASGGVRAGAPMDFTLPPPPELPNSLKSAAKSPLVAGAAGAGVGAPTTNVVAAAPFVPPTPIRTAARAFIPEVESSAQDAPGSQSQTALEMNEKQGYLPAGSFAQASLLSGVEAFTGGTAQAQPQPVLIRLDADALLPNSAGYQIKACHVLASVWGDMSSERVFGRLATLTCVDTKNRLVLSEEVEGNLIDSDGKNGIRGKLEDRQGAKLARSLLAGFAQGMASAFGSAQSTLSTTAFGTTSAINGGDALKSAGYGGANAAAGKLADFYMKQAESTMPVIAVDAGRKITVLFTKSKSLRFDTIEPFKAKQRTDLKLHGASGSGN